MLGQESKASCTEHSHPFSVESSIPVSAGEGATICTLSPQPTAWTEKPPPLGSRPSSRETCVCGGTLSK